MLNLLQICFQMLTKVKEIMCEHSGEHRVDDWGDDNELLSLLYPSFILCLASNGDCVSHLCHRFVTPSWTSPPIHLQKGGLQDEEEIPILR